eukprot:gnl/TRDRNA2_/TRDRNA2_164197_c0_seq1.p1 gnl/TRDRNA2_/TRDRNA2_164197_c0~~gnl/TRDRNA2_/TRDRNA2_164197_c0_seq1.p1  ORF type:complete len:342 (+),score=64.44 gnl/TRDRNA2_/TRDRNA2_164197_c0_seq1:30-1055(+)
MATTGNVAGVTECRPFFASVTGDDTCGAQREGQVSLCCCNVGNPANVGSMYRLCANFGVSELIHLYPDDGVTEAPNYTGTGRGDVRDRAKVQATARGTQSHTCRTVRRIDMWLDTFFAVDAEGRLPVVVIETVPGAVPLHSFAFPKRCVVVVGAEDAGVDERLLKCMVKGLDAAVYIPMPGTHKSMNVAAAATVALYEFRRQWPDVPATECCEDLPLPEEDVNEKLDVVSRGINWSAENCDFGGKAGLGRQVYTYYLAEVPEAAASPAAAAALAKVALVLDERAGPLALAAMTAAASGLVGSHDFGVFSSLPADSVDTVRSLSLAEVSVSEHMCCALWLTR